MSFVGGKLKLKGGEELKTAGGVTKKKKKKSTGEAGAGTSAALARVDSGDQAAAAGNQEDKDKEIKRILHGYELEQPDDGQDRRTEAEKRFEERQRQLEVDRLKKLASKSHRDRVKDFNDYLAKLSEHHDIPRVGPG